MGQLRVKKRVAISAPQRAAMASRGSRRRRSRPAGEQARGSALGLVGVVREPREFGALQHRLVQAARAARCEGVEPSIVTRAGEPLTALLREADETGADELFLPEEPRLLRRARGVRYVRLRGLAEAPRPDVLRLAA